MNFLKGKNNYFQYLLILLAFLLLTVIVDVALYFTTHFEKEITISNKYIRTTRRSSRYHLVDQKDENYRVNNLWFKGDFNRGDDYGLLKEGNTYKVKGYGIRVPVLNMYKNIYSVKKV